MQPGGERGCPQVLVEEVTNARLVEGGQVRAGEQWPMAEV